MKRLLTIILFITLLSSCGIYSFSGTSIAPDVSTITIYSFENRAMRVNPALSNTLTENLKDKFRKLTKLKLMNEDGDLIIDGQITGYETASISVTAQEIAAQNRLTITIKITFTNVKYPKENFERSFVALVKLVWLRV